ncbi:amino acid adenylation domain-containing protein [Robbsia sp. Bb-Pol-6]|uniref:Amino acid adenylation domain-containing protein n=1 Tax=Robbsia betulipollinis TaxID=2981849 RepID=A0ABT3ZS94_9BURK|nr:amino acid adenylation domain-containing protein [Robbsia betulipollinis]MCY0389423.1 amino acid adenylation domain-containing protein [Robbsia betulipollinis]
MLDSFFFDTAARLPDAPALWVDAQLLSYRTLAEQADRVADGLQRLTSDIVPAREGDTPACLLFAHRSAAAYGGLLGILASGHAYVPLGAHFPPERNAAIARRSGARVLLVDRDCATRLAELQPLLDPAIRIVAIESLLAAEQAVAVPDAPQRVVHARRTCADLAYVLFTSGTTGVPKGVKVTHANATAYMRSQVAVDPAAANARYSQAFDLTFDLSVHDMFVCWANAGCLYVPPSSDPLTLFAFVRQHALTHWGSVPSTAAFIQQFRKLKPDVFPSLRMTMFCGEALPTSLAQAWALAAPHSRIRNLYGPTEATIACMRFEVERPALARSTDAVVPLGWSLPGEETLVVDAQGEPVADGEKGELLLAGAQLAAGYISDNPADHAKFFDRVYAGRTARRWYRTGDLASVSASHGMRFHGRTDSQVKIRGHRIETQEVEHALRLASGALMVAVIPWPRDATGMANGLVGFVTGTARDDVTILAACRQQLPLYAVPSRVVRLDAFPVNANGKIDRNALLGHCPQTVARVAQPG